MHNINLRAHELLTYSTALKMQLRKHVTDRIHTHADYSADWETVALTHKQAQKAVRRRLLASKIKCKQHKMENIYKNQPSKCFMRKEMHLT